MTQSPIDQLFAKTTVSTQAVKQYLDTAQGYLQACSIVQGSAHMRTTANHADYVEFHLRRYLVGNAKTLHRVLYEVRAFIAFDKLMAQTMMTLIFRENQKTLLQNEWYEFMSRLEYARTQVKQLFLQ